MSVILVDMDGVLADWGAGYGRHLDYYAERAEGIPRHQQQTSFDLMAGLNEDQRLVVRETMNNMDYFALDPIPGAKRALYGMLDYGHDVLICTSPWNSNRRCVDEKFRWVGYHLGSSWLDRVIITKDKTMVQADILVDDKPLITGRYEPTWTQVLFDQPYNQGVTGRDRLMTWDDWKSERY